MIVILDDVLSDEGVKLTRQIFENEKFRKNNWLDTTLDHARQINSPIASLIQIASNFFGISSMVGCEIWAHYGTRPEWHQDKDELAGKNGELKFPLCGIVYYPLIENLVGGRLLTGSEQIVPKTNRMVLFSPGILHTVEPYEGNRMSVAINPWNYTLSEYK